MMCSVTGPAWTNSVAGAGARGTGAGTTQLQRLSGLWVNAVQITGNNGVNSYTIAANQATYVGSILIDQTAGQISNFLSYGQNRKWAVSNAYNRQPILLQVGDPTVGWSYNTVTRASNGTSGNAGTALMGLPEEVVNAAFNQTVWVNGGGIQNSHIGIGFNSTSSFIGQIGSISAQATVITGTVTATYMATPTIGINTFTTLENGNANTGSIFSGTITNMLMMLRWRG